MEYHARGCLLVINGQPQLCLTRGRGATRVLFVRVLTPCVVRALLHEFSPLKGLTSKVHYVGR